ncbi:MAG: Ribonuclease Y [Parcubacteria group bacterium ADurb.Bin316]|nr:MAG: Ribonuclease Y [Parcubacteria group bacterium ADurb.Bin316]HOZ55652.1 ribonuclease Y [bacterium]
MEFIIYGILLVIGGFFVGYWLRKLRMSRKIISAEQKAEKILADVKNKQNEIILSAQEKALKIIEEAKDEEKKRRQELNSLQSRLEKRETTFSQKILELQDKQQSLYDKINKVEEVKEKVQKIKEEQLAKLEKISGLSKDEAKEVMFKNLESQMKDDLLSRIKKLEDEATDSLEEKSRDILASTMQRLVSNYTTEITTTVVDLPGDEMKGRIIGREGRNIKVIEQLTGTEIIVDDTPNVITISGFSPIRRHIAKKTLERLILDGRIHPTKIEEAIEESKKELALDIKKAGEEAMYEVGVAGFDPKLVQIIGRLKYRTSYGQNALRHSLEVAHLSALLAEELGMDVTVAKKAGLLHDIGKAVDHEVQGTHPEIGRDIAKKFNLPQEIIDPIETHHDDRPRGLISIIVKVADAISAARPGARHDTYERYLQRLEELENIATGFEGVDKTYAIQAGREVRVFVMPDQVDDLAAHNLARDIAKKIERELKYPGEIKVNVIREMRVTEYAR